MKFRLWRVACDLKLFGSITKKPAQGGLFWRGRTQGKLHRANCMWCGDRSRTSTQASELIGYFSSGYNSLSLKLPSAYSQASDHREKSHDRMMEGAEAFSHHPPKPASGASGGCQLIDPGCMKPQSVLRGACSYRKSENMAMQPTQNSRRRVEFRCFFNQ